MKKKQGDTSIPRDGATSGSTIYEGKKYSAERIEPLTETTFGVRLTDVPADVALDVRGKCKVGTAGEAEAIVADWAGPMIDALCRMNPEKDPAAFPAAFIGEKGLLGNGCTLKTKPVGDIKAKCAQRSKSRREGR